VENNIKAARLLVEEMSASDAEAFLKWLQKQVPQKIEAETPTLSSAALWWLAKLKSGNVLPDGGWPTMLPVYDLGSDYINAMKRNITRCGNVTAMGRFLNQVGAREEKIPSHKTEVTIRAGEPGGEGLKPGAVVKRTKRVRHYVFFDLDTCRAGFERKHGKQEWDGDSPDDGRVGDGD
jgi:hypothetical protein